MSWVPRVFRTLYALKRLRREGWVRRGVREPESVADHSYALAVLSMLVAAERGLDPFRAAAIALAHDLPESITGDRTPEEKKNRETLLDEELMAMGEVAAGLPDSPSRLLHNLFLEYVNQASKEARLVKELDKLEMALQAQLYGEEQGRRDVAREFTASALESIRDPALRSIILNSA
jgi:putative hydrolase of HD superfamily